MQPDQPPPLYSPVNNPQPQQHPHIAGITSMLDEDEHIIVVIHKHIIGLLIIYLVGVGAVGSLLAVGILSSPGFFANLSASDSILLTAIFILALGLFLFVMAILTYLYNQNKIVVTNKNVMQILQNGLFARKISRLSLADVQDVTANQTGILQHLFNYGTLTIETAGEMKNFIFTYCPDPNKFADIILDDRRKYTQHQ